MTTNPDFELRFLDRFRLFCRIVVVLNWLAILAIWFSHGIPKTVAMAAFTVFRVTAVCASLWLAIEIAEATAKRTRALNPVIDAILTLPMFGLWFLAAASSF